MPSCSGPPPMPSSAGQAGRAGRMWSAERTHRSTTDTSPRSECEQARQCESELTPDSGEMLLMIVPMHLSVSH